MSKKRKKKDTIAADSCQKRARATGNGSDDGKAGSGPFTIVGLHKIFNGKHAILDVLPDDSAIDMVEEGAAIREDRVKSLQEDGNSKHAAIKGHEALVQDKKDHSKKKQQYDTKSGVQEQNSESNEKQAQDKKKKGNKNQAVRMESEGIMPIKQTSEEAWKLIETEGQFSNGKNILTQKSLEQVHLLKTTKNLKDKAMQVNGSSEIMEKQEDELNCIRSSQEKKRASETQAEIEESKQEKQLNEQINGAKLREKIKGKKTQRTKACVSMEHDSKLIEVVGLPRQVALGTENSKQGKRFGILGKEVMTKERTCEAKSKDEDDRECKGRGAPFKRVDPDKVEFADPRLKDNSYWALDTRGKGWGAKAQGVLAQVSGRTFRLEKTKKKRGTYLGGCIDLKSHSIKFNFSDDE